MTYYFKQTEYSRFKLYAQLGVGYMWYRSQLFDTETFNTKDFEGYVEVENTQNVSQKVLSDKTNKATTLTFPYGLALVYQYNHNMSFHLDLTQTGTPDDRLDAFSRSWTANDKYSYIGVGITYSFNKSVEDAPKKREKKGVDEASDTADASESASDEGISVVPVKKKNKNKRTKTNNKSSEDDELLNVRLKLFETQLKLFEMQYLLGQ